MSLKGKIALVTGGSRGIGAGVALGLAKEGADIAITYVSNAESAQKIVSEAKALGVQAIAIKNDVSDLASHQNLVDQVVKQFGRIDILVNNAGTFTHTSWTSVTAEEFNKVYDLNVKAPLFLIQKAAPHIPAGGSIINIGSAAVKSNGSVPAVVYLSSKFAVASYAILMAKDLAEKGIRINTVSPGFTDTDMLSDPNFRTFGASQSVFKRLGTNEDIANIVTFLADSKKSGWVTGQQIDASGGVSLEF